MLSNDRPAVGARPYRRRNLIRFSAATVAILATTGTILLAQPQPTPDDKGKARVVERKGPEVDVRANGAGQIVVLFPHSANPQGGGGNGTSNGVEVTLVESQLPPAAAPGQPAGPQTATPTGKEYVFNSSDARDQTVSLRVDPNGNARKLMVLAKVGGKTVEVRPAGGPEGVAVYTVAMPEAPKPAAEQPKPEGGDQAAPAAPAAAPAPPAQAAVIIFYSGGAVTP